MDGLAGPAFGALLVAVSAPALAYAAITGRLWVGFFPLPETFAPERISRKDDPRRYNWHLFGECICLAAGIALLIL